MGHARIQHAHADLDAGIVDDYVTQVDQHAASGLCLQAVIYQSADILPKPADLTGVPADILRARCSDAADYLDVFVFECFLNDQAVHRAPRRCDHNFHHVDTSCFDSSL